MTSAADAPLPRLGRHAIVAIFLLALAARLAVTAAVGFSTLRFSDAPAYIFAANALARTGHYPLRTDAYLFRPPGYQVFLVAATLGRPDRVPVAKAANAVLGAVGALLLAALSARLFRRRAVAIATGLAAAVHPGFVLLSTDVQSEPLFIVLLLSAGFLLLAAVDRPSSNLALLSGAALALSALTRPSALALSVLLAAPLGDRRFPIRARAHLAASAALGFLLTLAPWTLRNYLVFRELIPVSDGAGANFYQGNSDWTVRFYELKTREEYDRWLDGMDRTMRAETEALDRAGRPSPSGRSRRFVEKALEERRGDPAGWALLTARKAWDWLRPYPNPMFWPATVVAGVGLYYAGLFALAAVGLASAPRPGVRSFVLAYLAVSMLSHVVLTVVWRYRVPYWDPVLILYASFAASRMLRRAPTGTA